jgi:nucleoside phosphorylase
LRLAIFSAFPQEIKRIVKNFKPAKSFERRPLTLFFFEYAAREIILVQAGMGARNAEAALEYVFEEHKPDFVLSIGFGGALYAGASAGDLIGAARVFLIPENIEEKPNAALNCLDSYSLEIPGSGEIINKLSGKVDIKEGCILTLGRYMKKSGIKNRLPADISFPVCDMETFFLAKLALKLELPFFAVRSITDRADEEIPPEFLRVTDESGNYSRFRALRLLLYKPQLMKDIIKIGRNSGLASNNLWHAVRSIIEVL